MKSLCLVILVLLTALTHSACRATARKETKAQAATREAGKIEDIGAYTGSFVELMAKGDFATAAEHFDGEMRAGLPPEKLKEVWRTVTARYGAYRKPISAQTGRAAGFDIAVVKCEFEKGEVYVRLTFSSEKQVSGLFFDQA